MASDTDTATPEPGRRGFGLQGLRFAGSLRRSGRRDDGRARTRRTTPPRSPSLLRRRREAPTRRHSPLTRRILLLNIVPVALLALGAVYLSDYEEELIDAELASLLVQGEMVAAGIGEVAVVGGETTVNRLDADAARQLLTRLVRPTGVRARLFSETGELLGDSAVLSEAGRIHVMPLPPPEAPARGRAAHWADRVGDWIARQLSRADRFPEYVERAVADGARLPRGRERAARLQRLGGAHRARRPADAERRRAGAALQAGAGRTDADARQPRHRRLAARGALRHDDHRGGGARHHRAAVALSCRHHHPADRAAGARRRRGPAGAREPAGDPRSRQARRRDRRPERRAALDDRRAVAAHQHHRELRRRRGARAQEPADLAAVGDRGGGAARPRRPTGGPS